MAMSTINQQIFLLSLLSILPIMAAVLAVAADLPVSKKTHLFTDGYIFRLTLRAGILPALLFDHCIIRMLHPYI